MSKTGTPLPFYWRIIRKLKDRQVKIFRRVIPAGKVVLLLTTIGRKSGLERVTPLQYEERDGKYYVASARGVQSDWFRNIQANPQVKVEILGTCIDCLAEPVTDPERIADFLEIRLHKHPIMVRTIMTIAGLPFRFNRRDLVHYAQGRAMVILNPSAAVEKINIE